MASAPPGPGITIGRTVLRDLARGGDALSSPWTAVAVGVLAVALLVLLVVRRRRRLRAWPVGVLSGVAFVLALALGANAVSGYVPNVQSLQTTLSGWGLAPAPFTHHGQARPVPAGPGQGAVEAYRIPSPAALKMPKGAVSWVYTPPGYDPKGTTRYPVMYLVHGSPGHSGDWMAAGDGAHAMDVLLAHSLVRPMILVSVDVNGVGPTARDTECLNSARGGSQVETFLTSTVVAWTDATFRTVPDAAHRALGGFSSGGFCALDQGLRHPGTYGTVVAIDAYPNSGFGGRDMLATQQAWRAHDVTTYARTMPIDPTQHLFVAVPGESTMPATVAVRAIADTLWSRGQPVTLDQPRGLDHTWTMARVVLPYALVYYSRLLGGPAA